MEKIYTAEELNLTVKNMPILDFSKLSEFIDNILWDSIFWPVKEMTMDEFKELYPKEDE